MNIFFRRDFTSELMNEIAIREAKIEKELSLLRQSRERSVSVYYKFLFIYFFSYILIFF